MDNSLSSDRRITLTVADVSLDDCDIAIEQVLSRTHPGLFSRTTEKLDLLQIYEKEVPAGGAHAHNIALFSPISNPKTSIVVTNLRDGWNSLSFNMSREHKRFQIQIISTPLDTKWQKNYFETWREGATHRLVLAMRDSDRWVFYESGQPEPIEELELYANRLKKKRLDRDALIRYMQKLNYDLTQPAFWQSNRDAIYYMQETDENGKPKWNRLP